MSHAMRHVNLSELPKNPECVEGLLEAAAMVIEEAERARKDAKWDAAARLGLVENALFVRCAEIRKELTLPYRVRFGEGADAPLPRNTDNT